jgi:ribose 1,5-bisphosphokinase PhnN
MYVLLVSQVNLTANIQVLKDKLFEMDREHDDQITQFKKHYRYDTTKREQLEQIKEKPKME